MPDDDWDIAEEVAARQILAEDTQQYSSSYGYRRHLKGCVDGAHIFRRNAAGLRVWECVRCAARQLFNTDG